MSGTRRTTSAPPIPCWAFTAARGWHLSTVDVDQIVACELEDRTSGHVASGQPSALDAGLIFPPEPNYVTEAAARPPRRTTGARRGTSPPSVAELLDEAAAAAARWSRPGLGSPHLRSASRDVA